MAVGLKYRARITHSVMCRLLYFISANITIHRRSLLRVVFAFIMLAVKSIELVLFEKHL